MATGRTELVERRSTVEAAREALARFGEVLAGASGAELGELLSVLDEVVALGSAARVSVSVEAARRGEVAGSEVQAWVREHAPSLRQGGAAAVARIALDVAAAGAGLDGGGPAEDSPLGIVWDAVREGRLETGTGCAVLRESARLEPLLRPEAVPTVATALVTLAAEHGTTLMRRLRPRLIADHGHHGALDDLQERLRGAARLSMPHVESGDLTEYQLWMTPEQAATLEAAIGPLSAPAPNEETGERDLRPAGQRRVEALTQVCAAASGLESLTDAGSPATLHVTMSLADLQAGTGAAEVLGSVADGTVIGPETLRRLACDAALVPHVLGTADEPLTLGRLERLFTRPQRRHLWLRDRGCTYPGCTAPAAWARAHHIRHWADGGTTDDDSGPKSDNAPTSTAATSSGTWSTAPTTAPSPHCRPRERPIRTSTPRPRGPSRPRTTGLHPLPDAHSARRVVGARPRRLQVWSELAAGATLAPCDRRRL